MNSRNRFRLVFLAGDPLDWLSMHSLYLACRADPRFQATIVQVGFRGWLNFETNCKEFFDSNGIPFLQDNGTDELLKRIAPDLIVVSSPYDEFRPPHYKAEKLARLGRLLYIPYGIDFADARGIFQARCNGSLTARLAWRVVSRSHETVDEYVRWSGGSRNRIISEGLPVNDLYHLGFGGAATEWDQGADRAALRILYTPHHSLDGWSTFTERGREIVRFVQNNPDVRLICRPHPGLIPTLEARGGMNKDAFTEFFSGPRMRLDLSMNYFPAFRWSDVLVTDASSFLVQYAPTKRPIVYLVKSGGWGLEPPMERYVRRGYYVAEHDGDAARFLDDIRLGRDPRAQDREAAQLSMCAHVFDGDTGRRIADHLWRALLSQ
jgi:hypothetical protein